MTAMISPSQAFSVDTTESLEIGHLWSLTHLYQPIMGTLPLSLYITLTQCTQHQEEGQSSRHSNLQQLLNVGIQDLNQAREKLESLFLLESYRDLESHPNPSFQTIIYRIKQPLSLADFNKQALLRTALINQIGSKDYQEILSHHHKASYDQSRFVSMNTSFSQAFYHINVPDELEGQSAEFDLPQVSHQGNLNYSKFIQFLMSEGIDHSLLTTQLKDQVYALHQVYGLSESELVQIYAQALSPTKREIDEEVLYKLAEQRGKADGQKKTSSINVAEQKPHAGEESDQSELPLQLNDQQIQERTKQLSTDYPELTEGDVSLILSCEQMPNQRFLLGMKDALKGYVGSNEEKYLEKLLDYTTLPSSVINFMMFYLLAMEGRTNLYLGDLDRIANEWQRNEIKDVASAILYVRKQKKARPKSQAKSYKKKGGYQEPIPDWMKEETGTPKEETPEEVALSEERQDAIRARLSNLFGEEDES